MEKNAWWGYKHTNGSLQVKRYFSLKDLIEAQESEFVAEVRGPWECTNREEAMAKLKEQLEVNK